MRHLILTTIIALVPFHHGCRKKENLSRPTQEGKDVLWCKVNGAEHIYRGKPSLRNAGISVISRLKITIDTVDVYGVDISTRNIDYDDHFSIFVNTTAEPDQRPVLNKRYPMAAEILTPTGSHYYTTGNSNDQYIADTNTSWVIFTRNDNIIAGTFEFHGVNKTGSTIAITQGYFDVTK